MSTFLIFILGIMLGWWFATPNRGKLILKNPQCEDSGLNALFEQSTSKNPFVYCPTNSRSDLIDKITKQRICILCSKTPDRHQTSSPHFLLPPCPNTLLLEHISVLQHIGPILLIIDGLESLEPPDHNEDLFAPALDLLEDLNIPVLILHSISSEDQNTTSQKNQTPPPE